MPASYVGVALKMDGTAWAWGRNNFGGVGDNSISDRSSPTSVVGNHSFIKITSNGFFCLGLKQDGSVWSWGDNTSGQLGNNTITSTSSPVSVVGNHSFTDIATGWRFSLALKADGSCWSWGNNGVGQLGINISGNQSSPVSVVGNHSFIMIAGSISGLSGAAYALKSTGEVWAWGSNGYGNLGDNTRTNKSSPVSVVGNHSFIMVCGGYDESYAIKADGSAWAWGDNGDFGLGAGLPSVTSVSSPVSVVGNHSFIAISAGQSFAVGLKIDGSVWAWGNNNIGQIGNQTAGNSISSPVKVVGNHSFIAISAGYSVTHALKSEGTLWGWGSGSTSGSLDIGDNTTTAKSSPVVVAGIHVFKQKNDMGIQRKPYFIIY